GDSTPCVPVPASSAQLAIAAVLVPSYVLSDAVIDAVTIRWLIDAVRPVGWDTLKFPDAGPERATPVTVTGFAVPAAAVAKLAEYPELSMATTSGDTTPTRLAPVKLTVAPAVRS